MAGEPREAASRALLAAFHDLHPRIPGIDKGDCHCNLLAEVALDAVAPVLLAAGRRQAADPRCPSRIAHTGCGSVVRCRLYVGHPVDHFAEAAGYWSDDDDRVIAEAAPAEPQRRTPMAEPCKHCGGTGLEPFVDGSMRYAEHPMTQPYTDADVDLVAGRLWEQDERFWSAVHRVPWPDADAAEQVQYRAKSVEILSALSAAGRLTPAGGQTDMWEYGRPDPDEPDGLMTFDGTPRVITPRMVRRPMRAVGPWLPVPEEGTIGSRERADRRGGERIGDYGITRYTLHRREQRDYADGSTLVGPWLPDTEER